MKKQRTILKNSGPKSERAVASLERFIELLTIEKGVANMDPEVLAQIKADLKDSLERRINAALVAKLPPERFADFEKLLNKGDEKKIQAFFRKYIEDLDQVLAVEFLNFRKTYLGI